MYDFIIMMKRLAIETFCVALLFINSPRDVAAQQTHNGQQSSSAPVTIVDNSMNHNDPNSRSQSIPESHTGIEWANWSLVVIGGITAFAVCKQARESSKATKAMRDSIQLQELGMQSMVNTERAWVVISVDSVAPGEFSFWATNEGKTPAKVVSIWSRNITLGREEKLKLPPDEETNESLLQSPPCLLPPSAKIIIWQCKTEAFQKASGGGDGDKSLFSRGFSSAYIFGRIRYFDVLDTKATVAHETRWLYWLVPVKDAIPFPDPHHPEHNTYS